MLYSLVLELCLFCDVITVILYKIVIRLTEKEYRHIII